MERNPQESTLIDYSLQHSFAAIAEALVVTASSPDSTSSSYSAAIEPIVIDISFVQPLLELSLHFGV